MPQPNAFSLEIQHDDVAVLTFDLPDRGANILSAAVLEELAGHLDELERRDDLAGLIIASGKPGIFIAGADLREFVASMGEPKERIQELCRQGQALFGRLSKMPMVTVAAINGNCVGGGAELAVWCDRRVMSDSEKTEIGFPEVKLGLFPGWGGTARTPRIVGLGSAVQLITGGESIDAEEAAAMGLVSDVVPAERLLDAAIDLIRAEQSSGDYLRDRERWSGPIEFDETELGFLGATASAYIQQQTGGHYPAPEAALEVLLGGAGGDVEAGLEMEAEGMSDLFGSRINQALINVFFLSDRNKKDRGVDDASIQPAEIHTAAVIGAGIMGSSIAAANAKRGVPVMLTDASKEALRKGVRGALEEVAYDRKQKTATVEKALERGPLIGTVASDAALASADVIIEAVVESLEIKQKILARLEPQLREETILATNTSTIPITELASVLERPERFCGIHFFNPVRKMKLVEVIRGEQTSDQTVATAVAYAKRLGKSPIVVGDGPGFLVNRLLFPYLNESLELAAEGAAFKQIDRVARRFGMPMGPLQLYDMIGLDTAFYAGRVMYEAFPGRAAASPILPALVKRGRLGQKSGRGFYAYPKGPKRGEIDPEVESIIQPYLREPQQHTDVQIEERLFLPMLLEATRILDAGLVRDPRDVDLGLILGIGFPPFRGGLLFWGDSLGPKKIIEMLEPYEEFGERMKPTDYLRQMAAEDDKFYLNDD